MSPAQLKARFRKILLGAAAGPVLLSVHGCCFGGGCPIHVTMTPDAAVVVDAGIFTTAWCNVACGGGSISCGPGDAGAGSIDCAYPCVGGRAAPGVTMRASDYF